MTTPQPAPLIAQPEPEVARAQVIAWAGGGLLKVLTDIARAYQEAERAAEQERKADAA